MSSVSIWPRVKVNSLTWDAFCGKKTELLESVSCKWVKWAVKKWSGRRKSKTRGREWERDKMTWITRKCEKMRGVWRGNEEEKEKKRKRMRQRERWWGWRMGKLRAKKALGEWVASRKLRGQITLVSGSKSVWAIHQSYYWLFLIQRQVWQCHREREKEKVVTYQCTQCESRWNCDRIWILGRKGPSFRDTSKLKCHSANHGNQLQERGLNSIWWEAVERKNESESTTKEKRIQVTKMSEEMRMERRARVFYNAITPQVALLMQSNKSYKCMKHVILTYVISRIGTVHVFEIWKKRKTREMKIQIQTESQVTDWMWKRE